MSFDEMIQVLENPNALDDPAKLETACTQAAAILDTVRTAALRAHESALQMGILTDE